MRKEIMFFSAMMLFLSMLYLPFGIQDVAASEDIYIRSDGNVEGTDKIQRNGNVYTFIGDINETIEVQKDNIVIDGNGYSLATLGSRVYGFELNGRSDVTIKNTRVEGFDDGIWLGVSSRNKIIGNNITGNYNGVFLTLFSSNNSITGNMIFENNAGIIIGSYTGNVVWYNNITGNHLGTNLFQSSANRFYRNNFIDNAEHARLDETGYTNFWDNGVEGNFWSNYTGSDADRDGLGDID
jgi:parallel beta-helix repeat protein